MVSALVTVCELGGPVQVAAARRDGERDEELVGQVLAHRRAGRDEGARLGDGLRGHLLGAQPRAPSALVTSTSSPASQPTSTTLPGLDATLSTMERRSGGRPSSRATTRSSRSPMCVGRRTSSARAKAARASTGAARSSGRGWVSGCTSATMRPPPFG